MSLQKVVMSPSVETIIWISPYSLGSVFQFASRGLNTFKLFPHLKKDIRELTDNELTLMKNILSKEIMESNEVDSMFALYNSLFGTKLVRCNCPGLCRTMIDRIQTIMNIQLNTLDDN